jgi:predicted AlkP superfamily pyrophosphatase or phosphodiesterase
LLPHSGARAADTFSRTDPQNSDIESHAVRSFLFHIIFPYFEPPKQIIQQSTTPTLHYSQTPSLQFHMHNKLATTILLFALSSTLYAASPKLIVVISLDQFRYDYIARFQQHFGKNGFTYLLKNGANFSNASFKHATTTTGPGHATMLSGSYPSTHGIIANDWFNRDRNKSVYCVDDESVRIVGGEGPGKSPRKFIGSTLGDELRLKTSFQSKVISLSNKDRAAILMAGKNPSGVYWQMDSVFVTSTYYRNELPEWVANFNRSKFIDTFYKREWRKKLPEAAYRIVDDDDVPYEQQRDGFDRTFPHRVVGKDSTRITPSYYWALSRSPFGAEVLNELAQRAIVGEELGRRGVTDLLCVSFSSPDIVGHAYGPHSHEVMDMVLRMDDILADFLSFINKKIGLKNCLIVLTADHGVAPAPEFILKHNPSADAGRVSYSSIWQACTTGLNRKFGEPKEGKWIKSIVANNIYFDRSVVTAMNYPTVDWLARELADSLRLFAPIAAASTSRELSQASGNPDRLGLEYKMKKGFMKTRSGDVVYALKPYWTEGDSPEGASHGEPYEYDAHVPLIFVGSGIRSGKYFGEVSPVDIAPTLSALLGIEFPAGREGRVLSEALRDRSILDESKPVR